jgi:hypothetical protein
MTPTNTPLPTNTSIPTNTPTLTPVPAILIAPNNAQSAAPGAVLTYKHAITNKTGKRDRFNITVVSTQGWTVKLYKANGTTALTDGNGDGILDTGRIGNNTTVTIVVRITVPATAAGETIDVATVTAAAVRNAAITATATNTTTVADSGLLGASIDDAVIGPAAGLSYSTTNQIASGNVLLTVSEGRPATETGWRVTIMSDAFTYSGVQDNDDIPAANLTMVSVGSPALVSGQAVSQTGGPLAVTTSQGSTLESPRSVLTASTGYGKGVYTQVLRLSLAVPSMSRPGDYAATLTVTISSSP